MQAWVYVASVLKGMRRRQMVVFIRLMIMGEISTSLHRRVLYDSLPLYLRVLRRTEGSLDIEQATTPL